MKKSSRNLLTGLDALTRITGLDIITNHGVHSGPIEELMEGFMSSFDALVTRDRGVMVIMKDLSMDGASRDVKIMVKCMFKYCTIWL